VTRNKWQAMMVVLDKDKRLECDDCRALAVFLLLTHEEVEKEGNKTFDYSAYCQECFIGPHEKANGNEA
jgi:Pyruvate/2-oxoacid:ferredoxin oxidoreductase delta subunit